MFNINFLFNVKIKYYRKSIINFEDNKNYFLKKQKKLFYKIYFAFLKHHKIKITNKHISIIALLYVIFDKPKKNKYLKIQNYAYAFGPKLSYKIMSAFDYHDFNPILSRYLRMPDYKLVDNALNTKLLFGKLLFEILQIIIKDEKNTHLYSEVGELLGLHLYFEMESMMFFYNKKNSSKVKDILIDLMGWPQFNFIKRTLYDQFLNKLSLIEQDFNYLVLLINKYSR